MKKTIRENFRVVIEPRRLGDFGFVSMSDSMASRDPERDMRERCEEIAAQVKRHVDNVSDASVVCDERAECSHCGSGWETLTAAQAATPHQQLDERSVEGEPVCCDEAIAEFRTGRGIPLHDEGVVAYRNPDRPGVLLCREHGYSWFGLVPLTSDDVPDGGVCTYGRPNKAVCGRDVLIDPQKSKAGESA